MVVTVDGFVETLEVVACDMTNVPVVDMVVWGVASVVPELVSKNNHMYTTFTLSSVYKKFIYLVHVLNPNYLLVLFSTALHHSIAANGTTAANGNVFIL